jgi:hypothetical protein
MTNVSTVDQNSPINCLLCNVSIPLSQMRAHTGQHIMRHLYGMDESNLKQEVYGTGSMAASYANNTFRSAIMRVDSVVGMNARRP